MTESSQGASPDRLVVATDGSCDAVTRDGGWAVACSDGTLWSGAVRDTTSQRMELHAIREALTRAPADRPLEIQTDSAYSIGCLTTWPVLWRRRGWRTASGSLVLNRDLIESTEALMRGRDVVLTKVAGHSGHALNTEADLLAAEARRAGII